MYFFHAMHQGLASAAPTHPNPQALSEEEANEQYNNRIYDMVLLESEKERDVIQVGGWGW